MCVILSFSVSLCLSLSLCLSVSLSLSLSLSPSQLRVQRVYQDLLKKRRALLAYYGAIKGLSVFGPRTVNLYLVDVVPEVIRLTSLKRHNQHVYNVVLDTLKVSSTTRAGGGGNRGWRWDALG